MNFWNESLPYPYTNLGHGGNHAGIELENTPVLEHLLLGIQWALGDLKDVDATPKGDAGRSSLGTPFGTP